MKTSDQVGITFANLVLGRGVYNGVVNITLGAMHFTPDGDKSVDPDPVIVSRLRMDIPSAAALRDALDGLLKSIEVPGPDVTKNGSAARATTEGKPN